LNVQKGIIRVKLAPKHTTKLEQIELVFKPFELIAKLDEHSAIVILARQVGQCFGIAQALPQVAQDMHDIFQPRALFVELLRTLWIVPQVGLSEFAGNFLEAFVFGLEVKDTP
jgi:hypothetical protein